MKMTRYRFEQAVQEVKVDTTSWLRDEFKAILESDKDFTRKADYIGFSILSLDAKVASIDEEIKELQHLKKSLKSAKEITLTIGAEILAAYGIEKIEGAGISSITLSKSTTKSKFHLDVTDADALIDAGYYTKVVDEDAVIKAFELENQELERVMPYASLSIQTITTGARLKINKRRVTSKEIAE